MFRIGAFARLAGVSAKLLRAWDEIALFRPVWVDRANGYRYYSPAQLPEFRRIVALRDLGVPLAELVELVVGGADLRAVLARRRDELERARLEVERRLRALDISMAVVGPEPGTAGDAGSPVRAWDIVVRPVAAETVATLSVEPGAGDLNPAFYELEAYVRDLRLRAPRPPGMIEGTRGDPRRAVFVPVSGPVPPRGAIGWQRLPAGRAASVIHRGAYGGLGDARAALDRWVATSGLEPAGPHRTVYLQFGAEPELRVPEAYVVEHATDFVTELQLPLNEDR